jgi:hypothetical protein
MIALGRRARHAAEVDPDKLGRAAADIDDQKLLGPGRNERRAGDDGEPRLLLGLDDLQLEPRVAFHQRR